jgi:hypothetical protein
MRFFPLRHVALLRGACHTDSCVREAPPHDAVAGLAQPTERVATYRR